MSRSLVLVLAISAGVAVANIYYNQPMLGLLTRDLGVTAQAIAVVPVLSQVGYALGILFLSPLGDRIERKTLILCTLGALALSLAGTALAQGLIQLAAASLMVGIMATVTQQIVPLSAQLAPADQRGKVVGTVMMGLLLGILLARTISGVVAAQAGWREMYWLATGATLLLGVLLAARLPRVAPTTRLSYGGLMASLLELARHHRVLRRAAVTQALIFGAFSAFWSTLALLMESPAFNLGSQEAGAIGLVGAAGALAAPMIGRFADKRGPAVMVLIGAVLVAVSFVLFGLWQASMTGLLLGVLVMDLGVQAAMVSNQARVYALDPAARSRLNTVFMTVMFFGGAAGAAAGAKAWAVLGWSGVAGLGAVMGAAAAVIELMGQRRPA